MIGEARQQALEQRHVHAPPLARARAAQEREHHGLEGGHSREHVRDGGAHAEGRAVGRARDAHEAALALDHRVVSWPATPGAVRPVAGDGGVDEAWDPLRHLRVREAQPVEGAGPEVLDEHVRRLQQAPEEVAAAGILQVQRHSALPAVHGEEVDALALDEGGAPAPRVVALARLLDLDHVRARVRHGLRAVGAGQDAGEIDDADALQGIHEARRSLSSVRHAQDRETLALGGRGEAVIEADEGQTLGPRTSAAAPPLLDHGRHRLIDERPPA